MSTPKRSGTDMLVAEVEAVLSGTYVEVLLAEGRPVPTWAWTNALAHAAEAVLDTLSIPPPGNDRTRRAWGEARAHLAAEVLEAGRRSGSLIRLQRDVLVPMELGLMSAQRNGLTPTVWVDEVALALEGHRRERSADGT